MFGNNSQQPTAGTTQPQNPSMLDNVSAQDFTNAPGPDAQNTVVTPNPPQTQQPSLPPIQSPAPVIAPAPQVPSTPYVDPTPTLVTKPATTQQPAGPVNPPQPISSTDEPVTKKPSDDGNDAKNSAQTGYIDALTENPKENTDASNPESSPVNVDKLSGMKKQALEHLEPLVKHLDQKPVEEFKTTMMMIQANDNHTLLDKALAAAKNIENDQERAQAMLDIVNEINYFSQEPSDSNPAS